jgi:zinc D-Ala-D-Ala carboxypeptidase
MKLSKNFTLGEMIQSQTAIRKGIDNTPNGDQILNLIDLCENVLQPLRDHIGAIYISSGFRSQKLNVAIGGSTTSQHCALNGAAADIDMGEKNREIFEYIKNELPFDQLIWEFGNEECPSWVHVSYKEGKNRKQILKAVKENGRTKYKQF